MTVLQVVHGLPIDLLKPWLFVWNRPNQNYKPALQPNTIHAVDPGFSPGLIPNRFWAPEDISFIDHQPQFDDYSQAPLGVPTPPDPGFSPGLIPNPFGAPEAISSIVRQPQFGNYSQAPLGIPSPPDPGFKPGLIPNPFRSPGEIAFIYSQPQFDGYSPAAAVVPPPPVVLTPDPGFIPPPVPLAPQATASFIFRGGPQFQDYSSAAQPNTIPTVDPGFNAPPVPLVPQVTATFIFRGLQQFHGYSSAPQPNTIIAVDPGVRPPRNPLAPQPSAEFLFIPLPEAEIPPAPPIIIPAPSDPGAQPKYPPLPFPISRIVFQAQQFWQDYSSAPVGVPVSPILPPSPDPGVSPQFPPIPFFPVAFMFKLRLKFPPPESDEYAPAISGVPQQSLCIGFMSVTVTSKEPAVMVRSK